MVLQPGYQMRVSTSDMQPARAISDFKREGKTLSLVGRLDNYRWICVRSGHFP